MKQKDNIENDDSFIDSIRSMFSDFQKSRILLTAYELDIFTVLGDKSKSSIEVARSLGTNEFATDRLMNALVAIGFLEKKEGKFSNTPSISRLLVKGKPDFLAGLMHTVDLWDAWSTLTEVVRYGKSTTAKKVSNQGEEWLTPFIESMHWGSSRKAPGLIPYLDLSGVSRVLDVGGGSGAYSMAIVRAREGITATVFDLPGVIPLTKRFIKAEGLEEKIDTAAGDINSDELGSGYDLVFISQLIHSNSPEENRQLIRKAAKALNPGGQVVVRDVIMDEDRINPPSGTLFAINMLVVTEAGDTYTEAEVRSWMEEADLTNITRKDKDISTALIIGRKNKTSKKTS